MTTTFQVLMTAFGSEKKAISEIPVRYVDVPTEEITSESDNTLNLIYEYGQNDFQQKPIRSVSMGDIVKLDGEFFIVWSIGFINLKDYDDASDNTISVFDLPSKEYVKKIISLV
jgi:hypothetical protein